MCELAKKNLSLFEVGQVNQMCKLARKNEKQINYKLLNCLEKHKCRERELNILN